ncbi:hypothetical protein [Mumia quercus]|uniref:hypothetical protein n=1 Tax=Mumia quercus TaxID=2976125 RepID=UPI0021D0E071|nr:hypothetical protein [Mumia quercus]
MNRTVRTSAVLSAVALVAAAMVVAGPSAAADTVNVLPEREITGATTTPFGVTKSAGRTYVSNYVQNNVVVYAAGANGAAAPLRTMTSGLDGPRGVAVDDLGFTYVANNNGLVSVFAPDADTGDAPVKTFGTGTGAALGLDIGPTGSIFVRKSTTVNVYSPAAVGNPATTTRQITGLGGGSGVHVTPDGTTWVDSAAALHAFAPSAAGAATPLRTITGAATELTSGIVGIGTDSAGRVYASNFHAFSTVLAFAPGARGNVAPLKVLGGPATRLNYPAHLDVAGNGRLVVANYSGKSVLEFGPLFPAAPPKVVTVPGKPRALKVAGKRGAKTRKVSWRAPSSNGGARITGYRLVVKKGNKVLLRKNVGASKRSFTLKRAKLRDGRVTVFVKAKNAKGYGKNATKPFHVRK